MLTHMNMITNFTSIARHGVDFYPSGVCVCVCVCV